MVGGRKEAYVLVTCHLPHAVDDGSRRRADGGVQDDCVV